MRPFCCVIFVVLFLVACAPEKQQKIETPKGVTKATALEIQPHEATRETTFYIVSKAIDLSKAEFQWLVNGTPVEGASASQFRPTEIKKGDTIQAKALIDNREVVSNQITIKNIPPTVVRAKIVPSAPKANDILRIDVTGSDRDGDRVSFEYDWSKNGEPSGRGETLEGPFKRGDKISVKITPFDGDNHGQPLMLATEIYNSPPRPSVRGEGRLEDDVYFYQIRAFDPDGDTLMYDLKQAPKGMVIEQSTGMITWKFSGKDKGRHPVIVHIADGQGGEVLYNFDVTVGFE